MLGTAVHKSTALYDSGECSASDAADELIVALHEAEDVIWDDITVQQAEDVGLLLHDDWCRRVSPEMQWIDIEITLESHVVEVDGIHIELTGTMDRVYLDRATMDAGPLDVKSGARVVAADGSVSFSAHIPQLEQYRLLYEIQNNLTLGGRAIIAALPTAGARAGHASLAEVGASSRELFVGPGGHLETLAMYASADVWPGNPMSSLCTRRYCPVFTTCRWRAAA